MSSIEQLGGIVAAAFAPKAVTRQGEASQSGTGASPATVDTDSVSLSDEALQATLDHARMREWVERVHAAERASSLLVQRPLPDGNRPGYPSAVEAYREVTELIPKL
jgi:hypothetical protein